MAWLIVGITSGVVRPFRMEISLLLLALLVSVGVWLIERQGLYLSRFAMMRTVENVRLVSAILRLCIVAVALQAVLLKHVTFEFAVLGSALSLVLLLISRSVYRSLLKAARSRGEYSRPILLIGLDDQAEILMQILVDQPELGFNVAGVIGEERKAIELGCRDIWLRGGLDELESIVARLRITGAIVSARELSQSQISDCIHLLHRVGCQVQVNTGLPGIDQRRLHPVHIGYMPLIHIDSPDLANWQIHVKRIIDTTVCLMITPMLLPVLAFAAVLIKLEDRGPVLFRQERVGRNGVNFTLYKLRTMRENAENHLAELQKQNERTGPIFKMTNDPRVTKIGRLLRALSIDELPQIVNIFRGEMSLVGPRPALPDEAAQFDEQFQARTNMRPGITGLWQVEARDNPSFNVYRRLDLYYVENWSVSFDIIIILATIENESFRILRRFVARDNLAVTANLAETYET